MLPRLLLAVACIGTSYGVVARTTAEIVRIDSGNDIAQSTDETGYVEKQALPLVIWHGLGDAFDGEGIKEAAKLYKDTYPGAQVYSVRVADSGDSDRQASFLGNLNEHISAACSAISETSTLSGKEINALGFSQGGQFARALAQRCGGVNVSNLVTFGAQHNGIYKFADCGPSDWLCKAWSGVLKSNTWSDLVQTHVVPAQYFRDPEDLGSYRNYSNFLADVNNERGNRSAVYKTRLQRLRHFVMVMFEEEDVVHPKESSWFGEKNKTSGNVTFLKDLPVYKNDWLGLKALDKKGGITYATTPGKHMQIQKEALLTVYRTWFAPHNGPGILMQYRTQTGPHGEEFVMIGDAASTDGDVFHSRGRTMQAYSQQAVLNSLKNRLHF